MERQLAVRQASMSKQGFGRLSVAVLEIDKTRYLTVLRQRSLFNPDLGIFHRVVSQQLRERPYLRPPAPCYRRELPPIASAEIPNDHVSEFRGDAHTLPHPLNPTFSHGETAGT